MSSVSYLSLVQQYFTRYGMTTYVVLGNMGLLFNVCIFSWPAYRRNPCALYIFAASVCGLIGLDISTVPIIYALDHPNIITTSAVFCQVQFYLRHSFNQMMRTFFIFACADRYASSSSDIRIRAFNRYPIAIRITLCVPVFWLLLAIFPTMLQSLHNGKCEGNIGLPTIILSVYITITVGVLPLLSMSILALLILNNLKQIRSHVQPVTSSGPNVPSLRRRDRDMMRMLLIEIMCYISTTAPLAINLIYKGATQLVMKSNEQQRTELFINYLTGTFLLYFNNSLSFWIYIASSRSFRLEFKNLFIKCYKLIIRN